MGEKHGIVGRRWAAVWINRSWILVQDFCVFALPFRFQHSTGRRLKKFSARNRISEFSNYWQGNFTHASIKELNVIRPLRKITRCKRTSFETHKPSHKHSRKQNNEFTHSHIIPLGWGRKYFNYQYHWRVQTVHHQNWQTMNQMWRIIFAATSLSFSSLSYYLEQKQYSSISGTPWALEHEHFFKICMAQSIYGEWGRLTRLPEWLLEGGIEVHI